MTSNSQLALPWVDNRCGLILGQVAGQHDEAPVIADVIADRERAVYGDVSPTEQARADFIVRACNAHAALVDAVREFVDDIEGRFGQVPEDCIAYELGHTALKLAGVRIDQTAPSQDVVS